MGQQGGGSRLTSAASVLRWIALIGPVYFIAAVAFVVAKRIGYPFELEWMEGLSADAVGRVLAWEPLYGRPSVEYVPAVYTPLYFLLCAPLFAALGGGLLPLRLVSISATVGTWALIFLWVRRETERPSAALFAVGLYAATFEWSGAWFDIARCDAVFVFFVIASFFVLRFSEGRRALVASALLAAAAFWTKQTGLSMALALTAATWALRGRRAAAEVGALLLVTIGGGVALAELITDGWFGFFAFDLLDEHGWRRGAVREFWESDMGELAVALFIGTLSLMSFGLEGRRRLLAFYLLFLGAAVAASWLSRLHGGGFRNVLMPAFASTAILFGVGLGSIPRFFADLSERRRQLISMMTSSAVALQFVGLSWDPGAQIPRRQSWEAGEAAMARLATIEGDLLLPWHGYLGVMAGSRPYTLGMSMSDVLRSQQRSVADQLVEDINQAILEQRFGAIILDNTRGFFGRRFDQTIERCYRPAGRLFESDGVFWPVTGFRTRPEAVFVPRRAPGCGQAPASGPP